MQITLVRPGLYLPLPLVGWELSTDKRYQLELDVHTRDVVYNRLDSVGYRFWVHPRQVLASGTLPVISGPFNRRDDSPGTFSRCDYSPDVHRVQCQTPARIVLPILKQPLTGTFWLYLTDSASHHQVIRLDSVPVDYHKARLGSII